MQVDSSNTQVMSLFYSVSDFGEPAAREIYTQLTKHKNSVFAVVPGSAF